MAHKAVFAAFSTSVGWQGYPRHWSGWQAEVVLLVMLLAAIVPLPTAVAVE
jgi:hypothetical protein